ncbi:Uu.00g017360.m01.CDS01 [Anthostomella pinea]|uniref:Uu.00g017360.m01.CDS01 n=1 Tax=Anthostomella pinea TaxID=933095 RepID=A0AAI8VYX0_9PEZI|nr:Uu.00g017360.m01.CDS01 [Anthostomella pinea]
MFYDFYLMRKLKCSMRAGWPQWLSIRGPSQPEMMNLTIRISDYLKEEAKKQDFPQDPANIIHQVRSASFKNNIDELGAKIEDRLAWVVYTSNYIEVTGSSFHVTKKIWRKLIHGDPVTAGVEPGSLEYEQSREALIALKRPHSAEAVTRSRQEIINHSHALLSAIDRIVLNSQPITESFFKCIYNALCVGKVLGKVAGNPGVYRTWEVAASHGEDTKDKKKTTSKFIRASAVPEYMSQLVSDLHKDMTAAEETKSIDPYDMASRYCHRTTLSMSAFGGNDLERKEYLDLAHRAAKKFYEEDMEVHEDEKKGHRELARYTLTKSKKTLVELWTCVLSTSTGYPFIQVFCNVTGSKAGATVMSCILVTSTLANALNNMAGASRQPLSSARDQGLPFSKWFATMPKG